MSFALFLVLFVVSLGVQWGVNTINAQKEGGVPNWILKESNQEEEEAGCKQKEAGEGK